jgi:hypothetical protein
MSGMAAIVAMQKKCSTVRIYEKFEWQQSKKRINSADTFASNPSMPTIAGIDSMDYLFESDKLILGSLFILNCTS